MEKLDWTAAADAVRARRNAMRMTQDELAGASALGIATVKRLERAQPVSMASMKSVCAALGLDSRSVGIAATEPGKPGSWRVPDIRSPHGRNDCLPMLITLFSVMWAVTLSAIWSIDDGHTGFHAMRLATRCLHGLAGALSLAAAIAMMDAWAGAGMPSASSDSSVKGRPAVPWSMAALGVVALATTLAVLETERATPPGGWAMIVGIHAMGLWAAIATIRRSLALRSAMTTWRTLTRTRLDGTAPAAMAEIRRLAKDGIDDAGATRIGEIAQDVADLCVACGEDGSAEAVRLMIAGLAAGTVDTRSIGLYADGFQAVRLRYAGTDPDAARLADASMDAMRLRTGGIGALA